MPYVYIILGILGLVLVFAFGIITIKVLWRENNSYEDVPYAKIEDEHMEKHAMDVSEYHQTVTGSNSNKKLIKKLNRNYKSILNGYEYMDKEIREKRETVPAVEWIIDNLYLIEKEYKDIKYNMPRNYYKKLPVIDLGALKGYPRIYHLALEIVSHSDGKVNEDTIISFAEAYQKESVLTSAELWILPTMLRIAILQNIDKTLGKIVKAQKDRHKAEEIGDRLINAANAHKGTEELSAIAEKDIEFSPHFTERLLKLLRDNAVDDQEVYSWIDKKLDVLESNTEKMIIIEHKRQVGFQLSLGNCINSIRAVEALNWKNCFEKLSYVEEILKQDPSGIYEKMDFDSRNYYRNSIEALSKYMKLPESYVAKMCIECTKEAINHCENDYEKHVGYYIIDKGIKCLKKKINYKERGFHLLTVPFKHFKTGWFILGNILGTALVMAAIIIMCLAKDNNIILWKYMVTALVITIPCSEIVNSIINWSIIHLIQPKFVPKIQLKDGIPDDCKTLVCIPALLNNEKRAKELIEQLEVYYLGNQERNLYFAILGDFLDSNMEKEPNDIKIVEAAVSHINLLNEKYKRNGEKIFYILNRYRKFNKKQNVWMGLERKRGKIMELNRLLRGDNHTSYNVLSSSIENLQQIKYVITLDADTQIPRDTAKRLIGAMSHVLNKVYINNKDKKVIRGYGIMQPRISISTISANKTLYSKIFSGETGIDTYSTAFRCISGFIW